MLGVRASLVFAQRLKLYIASRNLSLHGHKPKKSGGYIYFPIKEKISMPSEFNAEFGDYKFESEYLSPKSVFEAIENTVPKDSLEKVKRSFDIIGDIAVLEILPENLKYSEVIGNAVLDVHHNIKVVLAKSSPMEGEYRVRKFTYIAGENRTDTLYTENGIRMKVDLAKMYFSPRLATERLRIAKQVKPGEDYLVMFAGCGPFALIAGKLCKGTSVTGVEINPDACDYFEKNIKLNKLSNVSCIRADVRKMGKEHLGAYDRIAMPLPKDAEIFLSEAISFAKKGAIIHLYSFTEIESGYEKPLAAIEATCAKAGRKFVVLNKRVVRPFSSYVQQVVIDFKVN